MTPESNVVLWVISLLTGSMIFFGAVVAPLVFRALPSEAAGSFLRSFFPRYYLWGLALAAIAAAIALMSDWVSSALCLLVAFLFAYARQWLMPQINVARDAELAGEQGAGRRFQRLHRFSVAINMLQLLILLGIAGRLIW